MLSDHLRRISHPILEAIARVLARIGLTPNALTLIGLLMNVAVAAVLATGRLELGGALIIVASIFDAFDGALARHTNRVTKFGAFLDSTLDRYAEAALFTGLIWHFTTIGARQEAILAATALFAGQAVSYARARAEGLGISCEVGLFSRVERVVVLAVGLLIGQPLATLWVLTVFGHFTAIQRILRVYNMTRGADR